MTAKPGLTRAAVVAAAAELVEREGSASLSLADLAKELGVKSPSLYNHVAGVEDLRRELRLHGLVRLGKRLSEAAVGRSGADAVIALARAYRAFALAHYGLYELTFETTVGTDEGQEAASDDVLAVFLTSLRGYELTAEDQVHAARVLRSALHGFVSLEAGRGFGLHVSVEVSFERLLEWLTAWLQIASTRDVSGVGSTV